MSIINKEILEEKTEEFDQGISALKLLAIGLKSHDIKWQPELKDQINPQQVSQSITLIVSHLEQSNSKLKERI